MTEERARMIRDTLDTTIGCIVEAITTAYSTTDFTESERSTFIVILLSDLLKNHFLGTRACNGTVFANAMLNEVFLGLGESITKNSKGTLEARITCVIKELNAGRKKV